MFSVSFVFSHLYLGTHRIYAIAEHTYSMFCQHINIWVAFNWPYSRILCECLQWWQGISLVTSVGSTQWLCNSSVAAKFCRNAFLNLVLRGEVRAIILLCLIPEYGQLHTTLMSKNLKLHKFSIVSHKTLPLLLSGSSEPFFGYFWRNLSQWLELRKIQFLKMKP